MLLSIEKLIAAFEDKIQYCEAAVEDEKSAQTTKYYNDGFAAGCRWALEQIEEADARNRFGTLDDDEYTW